MVGDLLNLRLSCELGLGDDRHVDNVSTPLSVHLRLGPSGEGRSLTDQLPGSIINSDMTDSPSIQTTVLSVCSLGDPSAAFKISSTLGATNLLSFSLNGLPNIEWTTKPSPRKNVSSLMPLVRSMI